MPYDLVSLKEPKNASTGVSDFVLIARLSDFVEGGVKCPVAPFVALGDKVKIATAHEFKEGRGFLKFITAPRKNQITAGSIGEFGFAKMDPKWEFVIPGSYAELHESISSLLNVPLILMLQDSSCEENMWYQLGCDCLQAYITAEFSTGTTADNGIKGYKIVANCPSEAIRLYTAAGGPELLAD